MSTRAAAIRCSCCMAIRHGPSCGASVIPPLIDAGHRVIVPDQIGFGLSEKPTSEHAHSLDCHSANLVALVRQLNLHRLNAVCHDWGGPTGLSLALHEPHRIHALVVMSTVGVASPAGNVPQ